MILRVARHTSNLANIRKFYHEILGLEIIGSFQDHDGYDALFFGKTGENWHMEFTTSERTPQHQFDIEDALVFYPTSTEEWEFILSNLEKNAIPTVEPENPYWKVNGLQFQDPYGAFIILSKQKV